MQKNKTETTCVALIGCVGIDPFDVLSLIKSGRPDEVVLIGEGCELLGEKVGSLVEKSNVSRDFRLFAGDLSDSAGADIAIVSTSVPESENESPAEHLHRTANALRRKVRSLVDAGFDGVMLLRPCRNVHTVRMRFAIDVAFCDRSDVVVRTVTLRPNRISPFVWRSAYVLEAEAGTFARWSLRPGDHLELRP